MEKKRKCNVLDRLLGFAAVITDIASTDQETRDAGNIDGFCQAIGIIRIPLSIGILLINKFMHWNRRVMSPQ